MYPWLDAWLPSVSFHVLISAGSPSGLAWSLYKCAVLQRAFYGSSATKRSLGIIREENGISSRLRVSISSRYNQSCRKRRKKHFSLPGCTITEWSRVLLSLNADSGQGSSLVPGSCQTDGVTCHLMIKAVSRIDSREHTCRRQDLVSNQSGCLNMQKYRPCLFLQMDFTCSKEFIDTQRRCITKKCYSPRGRKSVVVLKVISLFVVTEGYILCKSFCKHTHGRT